MRLKLLLAGFAAGLAYYLALPSGPAPWLGWIALLPLFVALEAWRPASARAGLWLALPFGLTVGVLSFRWLPDLVPAADVTVPGIMWPALVAWSLYLGFYPWLALRLQAAWLRRRPAGAFLAAAPLWVATEWVRGSGIFAFSWIHLCQTQAEGGYLAPAGWLGGLGLSFLMVLVQAALAAALWGAPGARAFAARTAGAVCLLLALLSLPSFEAGERTLSAAAIQGDVSLEDKWAPDFRMENLRIHRELSAEAAAAGAELVVWPETAFPVNLLYDRHAERALRDAARELGVNILTGFQGLSPEPDGGYSYRNAAGLVGPNGAIEGCYSKEHLLPFGEFVPLANWFAPGVDIDLGQSNFTPGHGVRIFSAAGTPLAVFICYEMGFAGSAREAAQRGARLLVNITNDGWFEHPLAMELHAALSPMRAAENGLPVLRCGNSGISEIIDARGRLLGRLPQGRRAWLLRQIPIPARPSFYSRHGGWSGPLLFVLYSLLALVLSERLKRRSSSEDPSALQRES